MNSAASDPRPESRPAPWWKFPIVWLVVSGPLLVVIAGLSTVYIAYTHVDPVLDTSDATERTPLKELPAMQGRNKAAEKAMGPVEP